MSRMKAVTICFALMASSADPAFAKINLVAAENFYGDIARQIGGAEVVVTSVMSNPDQDPHLFEASPSTARQILAARITIANGVDYDPWMKSLLKAGAAPDRINIVVSDLVGRKTGDNPHLWYDPATMSALARKLAATLAAADPANAAHYGGSAQSFEDSLRPLNDKIDAMKAKYAGWPVTASEPVFGYMANRLGLEMRNQGFQLAVMNGAEPRASDVAAFENDLKGHKVRALIYNSQADDSAVRRLLEVAKAADVPVVGVTETEPAGVSYQTWMLNQLQALDRALSGAKS